MDKEQNGVPKSENEASEQNVTKQESAALLNSAKATNGDVPHKVVQQEPADGGCRAYLVLLASFVTNGIIFSVLNSFSVIYTVMVPRLINAGYDHPESAAALVGSLGMGMTFFMSSFAGVLANYVGLRRTAVFGGCLATAGMFISSFFTTHVYVLYFTYSIMYATGSSLAYTPSLAVLSSYFKKRLGLANGLVCIGSSCFTVAMPPIMDHMIENYGLPWLFRLLALFTGVLILCGFMFEPIPSMVIPRNKNENIIESLINIHIWKIKPYTFWALCMPITLTGYFIPYVYIKAFTEDTFTYVNTNLPLQSMAFASGCGRLLFGFLADKPDIDPLILQQISFYAIGVLTIILPFIRLFPIVLVLAFAIGIFDGGFVSLMGPIAVELCGGANAAQSIGYMLGMVSIPLSIGPPVAGKLYNVHKSYTLPFTLAGCFPIIGATLMFSCHLVRRLDQKKQKLNGINGAAPLTVKSDHQGPLLFNDQSDSNQEGRYLQEDKENDSTPVV